MTTCARLARKRYAPRSELSVRAYVAQTFRSARLQTMVCEETPQMARHSLGLAMLAVVALVGASCGQRDNAELDNLRRQIEALDKKVGDLRPTAATSFVYAQMKLVPQGSACKIGEKTNPVVVKPSQWVIWTVDNTCPRSAELEFFDPRPDSGNGSNAGNPLSAVVAGVIPGNSTTGGVFWVVKSKEELNPPSGHPKDKWTYKWKLNNAVQQDPELEVEY